MSNWKYDRLTKTYSRNDFMIEKKIAFWGEWFSVKKSDGTRITGNIKKLSHAKDVCDNNLYSWT